MLTVDQLRQIMPLASAGVWVNFLGNAMQEFDINTPARAAAFLATLAHESDQLRITDENLNYSAQGLAETWPARYANPDKTPNTIAVTLSRNPQAIANHVYASRMGNGDEASGDGWRYRGAGPMQITGKTNQLAAAQALAVAPDNIGSYLRTPLGGARSAAHFWLAMGCNQYADSKDFDGVCDIVNLGRKTPKIGDAIGYADRLKFYTVACDILGA